VPEVSQGHDRDAPGWRLDELASAGRENLDADHVARYDGKEDAGADGELRLLEKLGLGTDTEIVDLGAGTGQFAVAAAAICKRVVAVDISPVMVRRLQHKLADAGVTNVEVVQAGFLSYEHRGRPADMVYSRFALHHLPDAWKAVALERIRDLLRPGGILRLWDIVYDFDPAEAEERFEAWCATGVKGDWSREELEEHIRDEHSTFTWLLEPMIERCGLVIEDRDRSPDGFFVSYVARRP
jgi:FkbM family methyltransferase